ncbi:hypothetical protein ElyMa_005983800 [Elysia marginata]|uniref:Uncharacterized protein n=1 Tax=Elysia marginata TaxID=1093978 RepID=A0AAV4GDN0_9GAST|nr:hypothetical protein ElyMa_005983800 [Elysia marginata]
MSPVSSETGAVASRDASACGAGQAPESDERTKPHSASRRSRDPPGRRLVLEKVSSHAPPPLFPLSQVLKEYPTADSGEST